MQDDVHQLFARLAPFLGEQDLVEAISFPCCLRLPAEWLPDNHAVRRAALRNLIDQIQEHLGVRAALLDGAGATSADDVDRLTGLPLKRLGIFDNVFNPSVTTTQNVS